MKTWLPACLLLASSALAGVQQQDHADHFQQLASRFADDYAGLAIPRLVLSFTDNLAALGSPESLRRQLDVLQRYQRELAKVDPHTLTLCQRMDHAVMQNEIGLGLQRAQLGLRYLDQPAAVNPQRLGDVALGVEWYRYFLQRWNDTDIGPDALYAFGEQALQTSVAAYDALQHELGFAGDRQGLEKHLSDTAQWLDGGQPTLALFRNRQQTVWRNMDKLFTGSHGVSPATVARSGRGESFPAVGYYEPDQRTFFYNLLQPEFEARQADWLFLHEATPGHHFQIIAGRLSTRCDSMLPPVYTPAYSEGWAAYVETLGETLGLYQTPEEKLAAIEWDMVRSVRVVLDVGLNAYGWSDSRALEYWHRNVRGQRDIAGREIARMKRWPAQVITYKFGAAMFQRLKRQYSDGPEAAFDSRLFHDVAVAYGAMPLSGFEALLPELLRTESMRVSHPGGG